MKTLRILASAGLLASGLAVASGTLGAAGAAVAVKNCAPAHLKVSVGVAQGTAGTIYYPILFTNTGPTCALWGVPKVQPVVGGTSHSRVKVGPPARNVSIGQMPVRRVVKTGHAVSDAYGVSESGNYTPSACLPKNANAIVVSMGTFVNQVYVPLKISVCTKLASTTTRLIVLGTTGA
ncbi:MAG TPA: DUF4232 domain-containing protein [Acidimicrobiales bacterium]